jgi:hypothetical protein
MTPNQVPRDGPYSDLQNLRIIDRIIGRGEEFYEKALVFLMEEIQNVGI